MQHFLKIGGKRYGEVRKFKRVRKFASSNLKFRSSKFKFTEILICNPGNAVAIDLVVRRLEDADSRMREAAVAALGKIAEKGGAAVIEAVVARVEWFDR